jgi:hypothetical protein
MFALSALVLFAACRQQNNHGTAENTLETEVAPAITLAPMDSSIAYPDAKLLAYTYKKGKFDFKIEGKGYELGQQTPDAAQKLCANSAEGQHLHLIFDNEPYLAKYTASFEEPVPDGDHYFLAFLSRSYHESIKTPTAYKAQKIAVKNGGISKAEDIKTPMLFYSRPKGTYVGEDTKKVMLDFYLANATLGTDYKVIATVNDSTEFVIDSWQPFYLENLPMGDNNITLRLVDKDGNTVDTPLNPVSRMFTLAAEKPEAPTTK